MKSHKILICTPRWYTYGGMFDSLFIALHLAHYLDRKLVVTYPNVQFDRRLKYPAFLNPALKEVECDLVDINSGVLNLWSRLLTAWLNLSRRLTRTRLWRFVTGRIYSRLPRLYPLVAGLQSRLLPHFVGFCGLETGQMLQKSLGLSAPPDWAAVFQTPVQANLTDRQQSSAQSALEQMGLPKEQPFALLYVRDAGFEARRNREGSNTANADIHNFTKAVHAILNRGYFVLRVGDPTMQPWDLDREGYIDYVHTPYYKHVNDLYLYRHCRLWLGTMGGGMAAPVFYNRPTIVVNATDIPFSGTCFHPENILVHKHVFSKEKGRLLSLQEQMAVLHELPPARRNPDKHLFFENQPDEIHQAVIDWFESQNNTGYEWRPDLQEDFHTLREKRTCEVFYDEIQKTWNHISVEVYHHLRPRISPQHLQQCWEYGPYLENLTRQYKEFTHV